MRNWFKRSKKNNNRPDETGPPQSDGGEEGSENDVPQAETASTPKGPSIKADDDQPDARPEEINGTDTKNKKKGLLDRLRAGLAETRSVLTTRVDHLVLGVKEIDEDLLDDLEEILITADMGVRTTQALIQIIGDQVARRELDSPDRLKVVLRDELLRILSPKPAPGQPRLRKESDPYVILVVGVNGVGKTTTIAKLAHRYISANKKVMLAAADTFRAAAIEQLQIWSERVGADLVRQQSGADPSAVVYDALQAAIARHHDVVIIDTAGRLHTKINLMDELKKINRVAGREVEGAPHEILLVLDATTGQNAVNQARMFNEAVGVTHLAMTKLDGSSKGGILAAIAYELNLPISYIGLGEGLDDLKDFEAEPFVKALFD